MWIDLLISAPVTIFLMWLYWYSAPAGQTRAGRWRDRSLFVVAPVVAGAIIVLCHLRMDLEGVGLNVIAVASAYLVVCGLLGLGWVLRAGARELRVRDGAMPPGPD